MKVLSLFVDADPKCEAQKEVYEQLERGEKIRCSVGGIEMHLAGEANLIFEKDELVRLGIVLKD